jgi:hypothetical protein
MNRSVLLCTLGAVLLRAAPASAAGFNLGWNDCPAGASYSLVSTFACDTNAGTHTMVGSFVAPTGVELMSANEVVIDMQTGLPTVASWWTFGTGQCRTTASVAGSFDFTAGPFSCYDYWQGGAIGAISWSFPSQFTANRSRIKGVFALPAGDPRITSIPEGTHVYSFKAILNHSKSTGLGSCPGCGDEACLVINTIRLNQPPPRNTITLSNPAAVGHVVWQGWSTTDPTQQCPSVTPAKSHTWGSIKALYR